MCNPGRAKAEDEMDRDIVEQAPQATQAVETQKPQPPQDSPSPNWDDLKIFFAVCQCGSFSKAAESLSLTQPTVSRRIDGLERSLGTQLLCRSPLGVTPTDCGRIVLEHAQMMRTSVRELTRKVRRSDDAVEGSVRLAVPDGLLTYWLTPRLRDFHRANPMLSLEFVSGLDDIESNEANVHMAIQFTDRVPPQYVAVPLGVLHHLPFASTEYISTYGEPKTVSDLMQHKLVYHTNQRHQTDKWDKEVLAISQLMSVAMVTNSSGALVEAVQHGVGIGMLPSYFGTFDIRGLKLLDFEYKAQAHFWLIYERRLARLARIRSVIEWVCESIDKHTMPWFADAFIHPRDFPCHPRPEVTSGWSHEQPRIA